MKTTTPRSFLRSPAAGRLLVGLVLVTVLALLGGPLQADDRDLLGTSAGDPYVMVMFDTSGSMNWTPQCTQEDFDAGMCRQVCPTGDCNARMIVSDPASKLYQAKEAIYETVVDIGNVQFGFATYNQDQLRVTRKHWLYFATGAGVALPGFGNYPAAGQWDLFGQQWNCTTGRSTGCRSDQPAHLDIQWEQERVQFLPKGGTNGNENRWFAIDADGDRYWINYRIVSGNYGDATIDVRVRAFGIDFSYDRSETVTFALQLTETDPDGNQVVVDEGGDFIVWDWNDDPTPPRSGYFGRFQSGSGNTCSGWDANDDSGSDVFSDVNLRFDTSADPRGDFLSSGDIIPLDWQNKNRDEIRYRMAPNMAPQFGQITPDYGLARYLADSPNGDGLLDWKDDRFRTLVPTGSTPLGASLVDFTNWYSGCSDGDCGNDDSGWAALAEAADPDWICREKYIILITDGDETCGGAPEQATADLFQNLNIKTYVIGFGLSDNQTLIDMAKNGGTEVPFFPSNKDELVAVLKEILGSLQEEGRAFSQAAIPSGQSEVADKTFLTEFTPINGNSVWPGELNAFRKPVPTKDDGTPDTSVVCSGADDSNCFLWDAGRILVTQSPNEVVYGDADTRDLTETELQLGLGVAQRRVYYAQENLSGGVPASTRYFYSPSDCDDKRDLWDGMGLIHTPDNPASCESESEETARIRSNNVIARTLEHKVADIPRGDGNVDEDVSYILGDIFHSNQGLLDAPSNFRYFADNLKTDGDSCEDGDRGYQCFARKHEKRRKVLLNGANDGQLHIFNVALHDPDTDPAEFLDTAAVGGGFEVLSYVPRMALPIVKELAEDSVHTYGVDGPVRIQDVFIDTIHDGTNMDEDDREWRTIGIVGMREGGWVYRDDQITLENGAEFQSGYVAMDLTQPDTLDADNQAGVLNKVPDCIANLNGTFPNSCGSVAFGTVLWEFTDQVDGVSLDEDINGKVDLADTWSQPTIGRIQVQDGADVEDRFVAIFGGGFDRETRDAPERGNFIYMVDIETGQVIYKRQVTGAVPANPAGVDTNTDGFIDRVYFGTTAGLMYKIDMTTVPDLETRNVNDITGTSVSVERIDDAEWNPFPLFDTDGRDIFYAPAAVFVPEINEYALAFGTGDRDRMWQLDGIAGRFYVIVDESYTEQNFLDGDLPTTESSYEEIDLAGTNEGLNFLVDSPNSIDRGWYLELDDNERVVAQSFAIAGLNIFPTFQPRIDITQDADGQNLCNKTGNSRVFTTFVTNADAVLPDADGDGEARDLNFADAFVSSPTAERGGAGGAQANQGNIDGAWRQSVIEALKQFQPKGTRFGNFFIEVSFRDDRGRLIGPIPVPIGMLERNWREY